MIFLLNLKRQEKSEKMYFLIASIYFIQYNTLNREMGLFSIKVKAKGVEL